MDAQGVYQVFLSGGSESESADFASALDEVLSPLAAPRYLIGRYLPPPAPNGRAGRRAAAKALLSGRGEPAALVHHAVPSVMGATAEQARRFAAAWSTWVSPADVVRAATPDGEGILVTARGAEPTDATTALRLAWQ